MGGTSDGTRAMVAASEHPVAAHAVAEVAGALLEQGVSAPALLWVVVGRPFDGALGDVVGALARILDPAHAVGVVAEGVLAGGRMVVGGPSVVALAVHEPGVSAAWLPPGVGLDAALPDACTGAVVAVAADPFSVRAGDLLAAGADITLVGGQIAAGTVRGSNRIVVDGVEHREGAVVVAFPPGSPVSGVMVHGGRAVGPLMVVTSSAGGVVHTIDERPAAAAVAEVVATLFDREGPDGQLEPDRPDMAPEEVEVGLWMRGTPAMVRATLGPDGGLLVSEPVPAGSEVTVGVRSGHTARGELTERLDAPVRDGLAPPCAALCFLDTTRPGAADPGPAGDAAVMAEMLGSAAAGMLVGGVNMSQRPAALRGVGGLVLLG